LPLYGNKNFFVTSNLGHIVSIIKLYYIENEQFFWKTCHKVFYNFECLSIQLCQSHVICQYLWNGLMWSISQLMIINVHVNIVGEEWWDEIWILKILLILQENHVHCN
jgi:hypothetical protein